MWIREFGSARGKPLQGNECDRQVRGSPLSQGLPKSTAVGVDFSPYAEFLRGGVSLLRERLKALP